MSSMNNKDSWIIFHLGFLLIFVLTLPVDGLRPLKESLQIWGDEVLVSKTQQVVEPNDSWNITGTYRGNWEVLDSKNSSVKFPFSEESSGMSTLELIAIPSEVTGVHDVQGVLIFEKEHDADSATIRVDGVYIWPFNKLHMVSSSVQKGDDYMASDPYNLLDVFSSTVFRESRWNNKYSPIYEMKKYCKIEFSADVSRMSLGEDNGGYEGFHLKGLKESSSVKNEEAVCVTPILVNATTVDTEVYFIKAIKYALMMASMACIQIVLLVRQIEYTGTQSGAGKVSDLMIAHQAMMDVYLCALHLIAGYLVESLYTAFTLVMVLKFVIFSMFEMRYLHAIWKADRPMNAGEHWEMSRNEFSTLYSHFYAFLLFGGILIYIFHQFSGFILLILYSFWLPQIVINISRFSRKPLLPHYIIGITLTRMALPLYIFGCPYNFLRIEPDRSWCTCLCVYMGLQATTLLLQHYFGSHCFIPRKILRARYDYYRRLNHAMDCCICMTNINLCQNDCMATPCDHFFHTRCLNKWMDVKMECPTCRGPLPPA